MTSEAIQTELSSDAPNFGALQSAGVLTDCLSDAKAHGDTELASMIESYLNPHDAAFMAGYEAYGAGIFAVPAEYSGDVDLKASWDFGIAEGKIDSLGNASE